MTRQYRWQCLSALAGLAAAGCLLCGCAGLDSEADGELPPIELDSALDAAVEDTAALAGGDRPEAQSDGLPPLPRPPPPGDTGIRDRKSELTIQPDCVLQIGIAEDPALDGSYPVKETGAVELGYVGPIFLYNKTERAAEQKIRDVLESRAFRNATVSVKILRASYDKVQVSGAVNNPGPVRIGAGDAISLNDALLLAGGIRATARGAQVRIVKGGLTNAVAMDLEGEVLALATGEGRPSVPDVKLSNNDVAIVFSAQGKPIAAVGEKDIMVLGEVNRSGVYRFAGTEPCTMLHLILKMGGLPLYANKKAIRVLRLDQDGMEQEIKVDAEKILKEGRPEDDTPLENGDRVIVPARRISLF
ncbi:MAG: SLBB domain-containing protein [Verrucomicrobiota bacterium]|nr:SLBB domain-containing protein [Verrucomicrobiota bacterium]